MRVKVFEGRNRGQGQDGICAFQVGPDPELLGTNAPGIRLAIETLWREIRPMKGG
jgi:hypothetical protein